MSSKYPEEIEDPGRRRLLKAAVLGGGTLAIPGVAAASAAIDTGTDSGTDDTATDSGTDDTGTAAPQQAADPLQTFTHPGALHTREAFDRMAARVAAGDQPWLSGWNRLTANRHSAAGWDPNPQELIIRGAGGSGPENYPILYNDIHAAYQNALRWKITGNTAHADTARDICNAWSETMEAIDTIPSDSRLASGIYGYQFANAGEIIRDYDGFDLPRFQDLLLNVFYPLNTDFLVRHNDTCDSHYWANWDLCNMASIMAIGILCDDQAKFDEAVDYFHNGAGNGSLANAIPFVYDDAGLAQWQETGRDQAHSIMGIGLMGTLCEMAYNQGVDLYAADDYRFRKACEYVARYNLGHDDVPYTTYNNCDNVNQTVPGTGGRGQERPVWERVFHHYWGRLDQDCPNMLEMVHAKSPEGGGGDYGGASGGFDELGFGTLAYVDRLTGAPVLTDGTYAVTNVGSGLALDVPGASADTGEQLIQWTPHAGANQQWQITANGDGTYSIESISSGLCADVSGASSAGGAAVIQWTCHDNANQRWRIDGSSIVAEHSGLLMTAAAAANGAEIVQSADTGSDLQRWTFTPQ